MNAKKVLAMILATSMVVGSSMTVLAKDSEGSATGTGEMEGYVSTDVFSVVIPTVAEDTFDFIMDPQGLISATKKAKYGESATFESGANVFFAQVSGSSFYEDESGLYVNTGSDTAVTYYDATGEEYGDNVYVLATALYSDSTGTAANTSSMIKYSPVTAYSSSSTTLTVTNKSSVAAEITVEATLSEYGDVVISDKDTFEDADEDAKLYLALVDTETDATTAVLAADEDGSVTAKLTNTMSAAGDGAYEYSYDSDADKYGYTIVDSASDDLFDTYSFYMTGVANGNGNWSAINSAETQPKVEVVWTVTDPTETESAPSITPSTATVTSSTGALEFTLDLGTTATEISSVTYVNASGATKTCTESTDYTYANGTFTLTASAVSVFYNSSNSSRTYTITFDNNETVTIVLSK